MASAQVMKDSAKRFLKFVEKTGSPYHTVKTCVDHLAAAGFRELREEAPIADWKIEKGGKYYVTRNGASIIAFVVGQKFDPARCGLAMIAAHTDSPCLRVRPNSNIEKHGFKQIGVSTYGGGLWHTWFDRPLGMAGKVVVRDGDKLKEELLAIREPLMVIPNLAIHLATAEERKAFAVNAETHLQPVFCSKMKDEPTEEEADGCGEAEKKKAKIDKSASRHHKQMLNVMAQGIGCKPEDIMEFDMCLMDSMPPCFVGPYEELVSTGRIDNVASCWAAVEAIIDADVAETDDILVAAAFDHEEVGSQSITGADSNNLPVIIEKLVKGMGLDNLTELMSRSMLFSVDMAHAVHPNYSEKHQSEHRVAMHEGVVLKYNANQRYATNSASAAITREICRKVGCPIQNFVVRNDCGCGSTVGPMLSARMGVRTIDLGCTQWGMHSCRETCSADDLHHLLTACKGLFSLLRKTDVCVAAL